MNKLTSILWAFLLLLFSGCEVDNYREGGPLTEREGFTLSYHISGPVSAVTRASVPSEEGEDEVNSFYILFFENVVGGNGTFVEAIDAMAAYTTALGSTGKLDIVFPEDSKLKSSAEYKMLFWANVDDFLTNINSVHDLNFYLEGLTEKQAAEMLLEIEFGIIRSSNLPMSASAVKKAKEGIVSVELIRAVSRFDVFVTAPGYVFSSASIGNANRETTINEIDNYKHTAVGPGIFYGVIPGRDEAVAMLYAFENYVADPIQNDDKTTCVVIGLENTENGNLEYFRVNINGANQPQNLKRNHVYRVTVTHVKSSGDETIWDAYENDKALLEVDINGWTFDETGNVLHDGENILAFPTKVINFCAEAETRIYNVFTSGTETLKIAEQNLPAGITSELIGGKQLVVKADASEEDKQGFITLHYGSLSGTIVVTQHAHAIDFLELSIETLPVFPAEGLEESQDIIVSSSGAWEAEIYNGICFSFDSSPIQVSKTEGQPGESFNIYSIRENSDPEVRYSFAIVRLKDVPEVSRVLVLEQDCDLYLTVTPESVPQIPAAGGTTPTITVQSNGSWTAKIIDSSTKAGFNSNVNTKTLKGNGNDSFVVTLASITATNVTPIALVEITLDGTSISKTIQISQKALELTLSVYPTTINNIPAAGGTTQTITVSSNGTWTAQITDYGTNAGFESNVNTKTMQWTGSKSFKVELGPVTTVNANPYASIRFSLSGTTITRNITIYQNGLISDTAVKILTNNAYPSDLSTTGSTNYTRYVYNLGQNMRNNKLFGPAGTFYMPGYYKFERGTFTDSNVAKANIYQAIYNVSTTEVNAVKKAMNNDKKKMLMISYNQGAALSQILTSFYPGHRYSVVSLNIPAGTKRYFNQKSTYSNHPLITYLLKDGPFTSSKLNADNITLYGSSDNLNGGVSTWPSTFIPIIMMKHSSGIEYCVFGIDPTNRLIWCSDPGIFGSSTSGNANYENYRSARTENIAFLNNVIAWMTQAALEDGFIDRFK